MQTTNPRHLLLAAGLFATLGLGTACKKAQAKTKGVGDDLRAFVIKNCVSGERYCQVCAYGGRPTVMAVFDIDDAGAKSDLVEIEKILTANKDKGLTAFALFGKIDGGKFTPVKDEGAAEKKLKAMSEELSLDFPVTIVPNSYTDKEKKSYVPFVDQYEIAKSRTVMVALADNAVVYSDVLGGEAEQYEKLAAAVKAKL